MTEVIIIPEWIILLAIIIVTSLISVYVFGEITIVGGIISITLLVYFSIKVILSTTELEAIKYSFYAIMNYMSLDKDYS